MTDLTTLVARTANDIRDWWLIRQAQGADELNLGGLWTDGSATLKLGSGPRGLAFMKAGVAEPDDAAGWTCFGMYLTHGARVRIVDMDYSNRCVFRCDLDNDVLILRLDRDSHSRMKALANRAWRRTGHSNDH